MPTLEQPRIDREDVGRCLVRTLSLAALLGAVAGSFESLKVLATADSTTTWAAIRVAESGWAAGDARRVRDSVRCSPRAFGRPTYRVAPGSTCAAPARASHSPRRSSRVGRIAAARSPAVAGTLICTTLREMCSRVVALRAREVLADRTSRAVARQRDHDRDQGAVAAGQDAARERGAHQRAARHDRHAARDRPVATATHAHT
jgi:hypothetical protein